MTGWVSTAALADRDPDWKSNLKQSLVQEHWSTSLQTIVDKILDDQSLTTDDGLILFSEPNLFELGRLANLHKEAM